MIALLLPAMGAAWSATGPTWYLPHVAEQARTIEAGPALAVIGGPFGGARVGLSAPVGARGQSTIALSGWGSREVNGSAGLGLRVLQTDRWALGPFAALGMHMGPSVLDDRLAGRLGLALARQGPRVSLAMSLPLVGVVAWRAPVEDRVSRMSVFETLVGTELKVGVAVGSGSIRAGLLGPNLLLGYGHELGRASLEVAVGGSSQLQLGLTRFCWTL